MKKNPIESLITKEIEGFFKRNGIKYSGNDNYRRLTLNYFNVRVKLIPSLKRKFAISEELEKALPTHFARDGFYTILKRSIDGQDLNPFQSKGISKADNKDGLFNDWGIHHLHLSNDKKSPGDYFFRRANYLLFVKFTDTTAYFIDIQSHKDEDQTLWSRKNMLSIVQKNWAELLSHAYLGPGQWGPDFNDKDIKIVRDKGYLAPVIINDKAYAMIGDGSSSSGDNSRAIHLSQELQRWIWANENLYLSNREIFRRLLLKQLYL